MDFNAKSYTTSSKYFELLKAFNIRELLFLKYIPFFPPNERNGFAIIFNIFFLSIHLLIFCKVVFGQAKEYKKLFQKRQNHFKLKSLDIHSRISLQDLNAIEIHIFVHGDRKIE